ncbi:MAG: TolC family protein [bacterium]|nr:TolC family protein [bacterium]
MRKLTAGFGLACLVLTVRVGAEELVLDLERVVELALARNPALQATVEQRDEVAGGIAEAKADAWPQLRLLSSWSRSRNPSLLNSPDFEEIIRQFPDFKPSAQELWDFGVEVTQPVYTSGKVKAAIDLARIVADVTTAQIAAARLDTAISAAEVYYQLLAAHSALDTVRIQQEARRESLAVVEARYELGEATRLELLRARAAFEEVTPTVVRIRGQVEVEKSRLRMAVGLDSSVVIATPEPEIRTIADAEVDERLPEPPSSETLLAIARRRRPELVDLRLQADLLARRRVVTVAEGRPQVEVSGSYGRQARIPDNLSDPLFEDWRVALSVNWSLFDGGRRKGQVAQLESRREQLAWQLEDLENRITFEIEQATAEYRTARERCRAAQIAARAAREASRIAAESYQLGVAIQADLLDSQEQEIQSEFVLVDAFYDALIKAARLHRALGQLPTQSWKTPHLSPSGETDLHSESEDS